MRHRYSLAAVLALVSICSATTVFAAKPAPELTTLPGQALESIKMGSLNSAQATCQLGITGPAAWSVNYLLPPNDAYYTFIDPANCACPGGVVQLNSISIALSFPVGCSQPVTISVVPATGSAGCFAPNPAAPICASANYVLAPAAPGDYLFTMALPPGCCIQGPAFIAVNFVGNGAGCSTSATRPRLLTNDGCSPCTTYNIYPGGNDDLCDVGFPGNPIMFADADCCGATPTQSNTWGRVKLLYR